MAHDAATVVARRSPPPIIAHRANRAVRLLEIGEVWNRAARANQRDIVADVDRRLGICGAIGSSPRGIIDVAGLAGSGLVRIVGHKPANGAVVPGRVARFLRLDAEDSLRRAVGAGTLGQALVARVDDAA